MLSDSKISGFAVHMLSDSLRIYFFSTLDLESRFKISGFTAEFAGCMWMEAVSGKKKLGIQKYPADTCGRGTSKGWLAQFLLVTTGPFAN